MPLPDDYDSPDRNYMVRVCLPLSLSPLIGLYTGSVVGLCDDCGQTVWIDEKQEVPPPPPGMEVHGILAMCLDCMKKRAGDDEVKTLNEATAKVLRSLGIAAANPLTGE
jgi:hypothetical protein